ncbi:MAG: SDR family NAD(P)-dependent oxidoreductase [Alsobacter sp.]
MSRGRIVIFGASRGLGAAFARSVPDHGEAVWCISRTRPSVLDLNDGVIRHWVPTDLSRPEGAASSISGLGDDPIDLLIYNAGIWETNGYENADDDELAAIVTTNLTSALIACRRSLPLLRQSGRARIVLIGSTCGLENEGTASVAYAATKFGLRGLAHGLREVLRPDGIPVTVISPGSMATDRLVDGAAVPCPDVPVRIPVSDLVDTVRLLRRLSRAACVKEIHFPALMDEDV